MLATDTCGSSAFVFGVFPVTILSNVEGTLFRNHHYSELPDDGGSSASAATRQSYSTS